MRFPGFLKQNLEQCRAIADSGQRTLLKVTTELLAQASERLGGVARTGRVLAPQLLQALEERAHRVQEQLDELNRVLAERAIPRDRREHVKRLSGPRMTRTASRRGRAAKKKI